jgi:hypothetical protein
MTGSYLLAGGGDIDFSAPKASNHGDRRCRSRTGKQASRSLAPIPSQLTLGQDLLAISQISIDFKRPDPEAPAAEEQHQLLAAWIRAMRSA